MISTPSKPFGNLASTCIACGKPPGLRLWQFESSLLCWSCWQRVEHLGHIAPDVISSCRAFRNGETLVRYGMPPYICKCVLADSSDPPAQNGP